jgi:hypothetical protein
MHMYYSVVCIHLYFLLFHSPDLLKRSAPARIVNVCSSNHFKGIVNFSHFKGEDLTYKMDHVYNNTKLHQIICTNELARMLNGSGMNQILIPPFPPICGLCCLAPLLPPLNTLLRVLDFFKKIPFDG